MEHKAMKVYLKPPFSSRGVERVVNALRNNLPDGLEEVTESHEADLIILHAIGRADQTSKQIEEIRHQRIPYVIIQYALLSTMCPSTKCWINLWESAELVWSYYDLRELCREDGIHGDFRTYHSPLGVDSSVFYDRKMTNRNYKVATCSLSYLTESVRECVLAAKNVDALVFHLGKGLGKNNALCRTNLTDDELAHYYSQCQYVSGLRRIEGFELPAVEGLFCGARPILFDKPHYRQWFDKWGIFIKEEPREGVLASLTEIFKQPPKAVTLEEIEEAKQFFNWDTIINGFWEKLL